jgi:hypothetical protein
MSRANLTLLAVLVIVAAAWLASRDSGDRETTKAAPRMFPAFNKEAADKVVIEGGWQKSRWEFTRVGSTWSLQSAGGYPVKSETMDQFVDAAFNLRRENLAGSSDQLRSDTRTSGQGRTVRVYKGETPMAEFVVGKSPERSYDAYFVRPENSDDIYRTRTLLTKDQEAAPSPGPFGGAQGFSWERYVGGVREWVETRIWDLGDAETQEIWLTRKDLEVKIVRKGEDEWELREGEADPVPADADAAAAISSNMRYLDLDDVAGLYEEVRGEYGLDTPEITLILTLKKKIEREEEEKPPADEEKADEGEEEKDGDEEKKEEPKEEFKIIRRTVEVGAKVKRADRWDEEKGEVEEKEYYPIRIGGDFENAEEEERSRYVFLVDDYEVRDLNKSLDELKQEPAEEEEKKEDEQGPPAPEEKAGTEPTPGEGEEEKPTPEEKKEEDSPPPEKKTDTDPAPPKKKEDGDKGPPKEKKDGEPAPPKEKKESDPQPAEKNGKKKESDPAPPKEKKEEEPAPPKEKKGEDPAPPEKGAKG